MSFNRLLRPRQNKGQIPNGHDADAGEGLHSAVFPFGNGNNIVCVGSNGSPRCQRGILCFEIKWNGVLNDYRGGFDTDGRLENKFWCFLGDLCNIPITTSNRDLI
ncbi:hypothetical protein TNIN_165981 [Trichonephila inaurata madagascariensis]|uniref:Uncharacterized protein n=1 Tax=Trichonephila inaurata madagascariensis TaxID=2747483 RepID=A0A8X6YIA8_9ARAC|nr:hypothetical protein TNIN_165981 [Trichonephila inaurata madagascariensis]